MKIVTGEVHQACQMVRSGHDIIKVDDAFYENATEHEIVPLLMRSRKSDLKEEGKDWSCDAAMLRQYIGLFTVTLYQTSPQLDASGR